MIIESLVLQTNRVSRLYDFYCELLEFPLAASQGNRLEIAIGQSKLIFEETSIGEPFYHFAFNIPFDSINEARQWLLDRNVSLIWMDDYKSDIAEFVNWRARSVYFYDPAGNIVELIGRKDLNREKSRAFTVNQVFSISEIGIVYPAVELDLRTNQLIAQYGLKFFEKQPPLPQFKALGDDEGLFIIVPEHRNWYPTDTASAIFPMEIYFDGKKLINP